MEIEVADGTAAGIGANLYPRSANSGFAGYESANFPTDTLYTVLGIGSAAMLGTPIYYPGEVDADGHPVKVVDWVKDTLVNTDGTLDPNTGQIVPTLIDGVATGIITSNVGALPNGDNAQTGVAFSGAKRGHWNGARIVDGLAGADQDIFTQGGKENQPDSWRPAPGSVGSAKFDITQAYIAHTTFTTSDTAANHFPSGSKNILFFGMERRGNDGTTAFDFEFDQKPPKTTDANGNPLPSNLLGYIPDRSAGDVLFTFEMSGSSTNVAVAHIFLYDPNLDNGTGNPKGGFPVDDPTKDLAKASNRPAGAPLPAISINHGDTVGEPWGHVDSKGNWTLTTTSKGQTVGVPIPNSSLAEAMAYFGPDQPILTNIGPCGGKAYVQVRTRSSVTSTSDLKDTTRFFILPFSQPSAKQNSRTDCTQSFFFDGKGSAGNVSNAVLQFDWTFDVPAGTVLSGRNPVTNAGFDLTESPVGSGHYVAPSFTTPDERQIFVIGNISQVDVKSSLTVTENGSCKAVNGPAHIFVYPNLGASSHVDGSCNSRTLTLGGSASGGKGPVTLQWDIYKEGTATPVATLTGANPSPYTPSDDGKYYVVLTATDTGRVDANGKPCVITSESNHVCAYGAINAQASKLSADGDKQTVSLSGSFLDVDPTCGTSSIQWQVQLPNSTWQNISGANSKSFTYSNFQTDDASPVVSGPVTINGVSYMIKTFTVNLRAHVERNINGQKCSEDSAAVPVKFILAVDP